MTEHTARTGPVRDVPSPRPVPAPPAAEEEGPLARAARAVADAVSGIVTGTGNDGTGDEPAGRASTALRDVLGAVASAVGSAARGGRDADAGATSSVPPAGNGRAPGAVLGEVLSAAAPRLPVRDAARLRAAHPGATDDQIADALVARAARLTAGIGAATGGLAAAHLPAPSSLLAVPFGLGAETVLAAAVEVVLVGELHELHGRAATGDARGRGAAYLAAWSAQRSADGATGVGSLLGAAGVRALQRQVTRRFPRSASAAAPLLLGAALAGRSSRRATEALAARVLRDLRRSPS